MRALAVAALLVLSACHDGAGNPDGAETTDLAPVLVETGPFAPQLDEGAGLTDVSSELDAVLEHGALVGACDRYRTGQTDRKSMLLCGKWMYFYETFGTAGIPASIVTFLSKNFDGELGLGFEKLGLVRDRNSADQLPLGMAPTTPVNGNIPALAFTCASCHFGKLTDGRYAVGAPNHAYDYGKHILAISLAPLLGTGFGKPEDHDAAAVAAIQPVLDKLNANQALKNQFIQTLIPLASLTQPTLSKETEHAYATWPTGTLDFVMSPLPVDDQVHIVGKIIGLWSLPRPTEVTAAGMSGALLGWTGDARSLDEFVRGFATLGGVGTAPTDETMKPLLEYVYSLRAPGNPTPPDAALVRTGATLYTDKGCATCHDGPRGSGKRSFTFDEIGTDSSLAKWADPDLDGKACCGFDVGSGALTHGVKSPRMIGMWALRRFLHNGALNSLDELFCLGSGRPDGALAPMANGGHMFTCDGLSEAEKHALIAYLSSH